MENEILRIFFNLFRVFNYWNFNLFHTKHFLKKASESDTNITANYSIYPFKLAVFLHYEIRYKI